MFPLLQLCNLKKIEPNVLQNVAASVASAEMSPSPHNIALNALQDEPTAESVGGAVRPVPGIRNRSRNERSLKRKRRRHHFHHRSRKYECERKAIRSYYFAEK